MKNLIETTLVYIYTTGVPEPAYLYEYIFSFLDLAFR